MRMLADKAEHSYLRPAVTAAAALDVLSAKWNGLTDAARSELTSLLAAWRTELYQAGNDIARGTVMTNLPYALEAAPAMPPAAVDLLKADHRSKVSRSTLLLSSDDARAFLEKIAALIGPPDELTSFATPTTSMEVFDDAANLVRRVVRALNEGWSRLSLRAQDQITLWLDAYRTALADALDADARLEATYQFLRHVKEDSEAVRLVGHLLVHRTVTGRVPMTADDAAAVNQLVSRNPGLQALDSRPPAPEMPHQTPAPPDDGETQAAPETINYHTDVRFPGQVSTFASHIPLRVRLTLEKAVASAVDEIVPIEFVTPEPQQVLVVCNAEGFVEETGDLTRTMLVYQGRDSQPAIFLLSPDPDLGPGTRRISLDFYHRERLAGTASFEVEVRDRPPIQHVQVEPLPVIADTNEDGSITKVTGGLLLAAVDAPRPDFVLRIALSADRRKLSYTLHSPTGKLDLVHQRMGSVTLYAEPRRFMEKILDRLNQMTRVSGAKLTDEEYADQQEKLQEIGWELYDQLFTPALRRAYRDLRRLREQERNLSLLIVSDEPWIPWEMILPHEDDLPDEDFLCAQFRMTRWLEGRGLPGDFSLHQARVVVPQSGLTSVAAEQDYFKIELPKLRPDISYGGVWLDMATQVKEAMRRGNVQWFHFACHGAFDYALPDESALQLFGGALTPSQIVGPTRTGVAASRPLVFLNACHTGEGGFSLTRMGGWAERFVRAGASAFIGSLWEVNDALAAAFAIRFYSKLLAGETLGDAFHSARATIRALDDSNPTWLAYTLYADPNARVKPSGQ